MVNEAEAHADQDKTEKDKIDTRNRAEMMIYQTEKQIKEFGDKMPESVKKPVEELVAKLKKNIEAKDLDAMKATMAELEQCLQKFGEEIYKNAQGGQQQPGPEGPSGDGGPKDGGAAGSKDGYVDAEIVDDDK